MTHQGDRRDRSGFQWWRDLPPWIQIFTPILIVLLGGGTAAAIHAGGSTPPPPPPSPSSTPATTPATVGLNAIYHEGQLALAFATCVDLDAPPSDRQWGEASNSASGGGVDLCSESPDFAGINGATLVTVNSGTDTACQNATGWGPTNSYQTLNFSVGSFVCVHTNQSRYSVLRVEAINNTNFSIEFRVKTFKKPGD